MTALPEGFVRFAEALFAMVTFAFGMMGIAGVILQALAPASLIASVPITITGLVAILTRPMRPTQQEPRG